MTRYAYNPLNFRLRRIRSEQFASLARASRAKCERSGWVQLCFGVDIACNAGEWRKRILQQYRTTGRLVGQRRPHSTCGKPISTKMMRDRLYQALNGLASLEFQTKYCVNGTKEEYMLPEEMVEDAISAIETIISSDTIRSGYSGSEVEALREFLKVAKERFEVLDISGQSIESLILRDDNWRAIRQAADSCLIKIEQPH